MMKSLSSSLILSTALSLFASQSIVSAQGPCQTVTPLAEFDVDKYISARWYSHEQRSDSPFQPEALNYCGWVEYRYLDPTNVPFEPAGIANGYDIKVFNYAEDVDGNPFTSDDPNAYTGNPVPSPLCAGQQVFSGNAISEITVGFCVVPAAGFGQSNYWVLAYDEDDGYALIAGGQTDVPTTDGLCAYSNPVAGLWIFSRSPVRNEAMIEKYRAIATAHGIDVAMLREVDHTGCDYMPATKAPKSKAGKSTKKTKAPKKSKGKTRKF